MAKTRRKSQRCMGHADAGDPGAEGGKRVVLYSDDDAPAKSEIGVLIDRLGFFGIDLGALAAGARLIQFSLRPPAYAYLVRFGKRHALEALGQGGWHHRRGRPEAATRRLQVPQRGTLESGHSWRSASPVARHLGKALGLSILIERQMASGNRCDLTASAGKDAIAHS